MQKSTSSVVSNPPYIYFHFILEHHIDNALKNSCERSKRQGEHPPPAPVGGDTSITSITTTITITTKTRDVFRRPHSPMLPILTPLLAPLPPRGPRHLHYQVLPRPLPNSPPSRLVPRRRERSQSWILSVVCPFNFQAAPGLHPEL